MKSTTLSLNASFLHDLGVVAEDEALLAKAVKYIRKLATTKEDSTLMTKEEFYRHIEEAESQYERGEYTIQLPGESVTDMLKRCGYV